MNEWQLEVFAVAGKLLQLEHEPELVLIFWLAVFQLILQLWKLGHRKEKRETRTKFQSPDPELATTESSLEPVAAPERKESPKTAHAAPIISSHSVSEGLEKTRSAFLSRFKAIFTRGSSDRLKFIGDLEDLLITCDIGVKTSAKLLANFKESSGDLSEGAILSSLKDNIFEILTSNSSSEISLTNGKQPFVVLVVGVNGVGKTTTIGKLARKFKDAGHKVLLGACDTFRAAATEQLDHWAEQNGVDIVTGPDGAKPSTVAYQSIHRAINENFDVLIVDTAGRLHTKVNLMNEISSLTSLIARELPGAPHETILVVDASTGQNALQQAREFHDKLNLTGIILTKLDGTPKGGIVVAIKDELGIPIRYVGVGEGVGDLQVFSASEFVDALFSNYETAQADIGSEIPAETVSARGAVRRKRREELSDSTGGQP